MEKVILASSSPRRRELLSKLTDFSVIIPDAEEIEEGEPTFVAVTNATEKGRSISEDGIVIACDTVVAMDGIIYGKPKGREGAIEMLTTLAGKTHEVISGVYIRFPDGENIFYERSFVTMKDLGREEIVAYVDGYEPYDKAGGYGIQDGEVVLGYEGDYDNIVGLPLTKIRNTFLEKGYEE